MTVVHSIFEPGLFANPSVQAAAVIALVVALVSAPVGVFTVSRGQSFAGHAFSDITASGGSAAFLLGTSPLLGFVLMGVAGVGAMEALGGEASDDHRGRDLATGTLLGASLGLSALLLYLSSTSQDTTGAAVTVLFGSIFALSSSALPGVAATGAVALVLVALVYRPLLLSSVSPELAAVQGGRVRLAALAYLVSLALCVALSALAIGAILSTALLIGPAATALRWSRSPGRAMAWAALISAGATWAGILLSYDSYNWPPAHRGWPVSFFVVFLVLAAYLVAQMATRRRAG